MSEETTYRRNKETILNRAKQYYKNYKERLRSKQDINIEDYMKKRKNKKKIWKK